jgi:WD40-like Beta Propeller Repeat
MRALVSRRRTATSAIFAASLAVLAACNAKATPTTAADPTPSPAGTEKVDRYQPGTILISDGSKVVTIGDKQVTFPTTVKDAVWSPDGSRIAFIDGEGRLATAHPDGTSIVYLAGSDKAGRIERPTWFGSSILATGWNGKESYVVRRNATDSAAQWQTKDWNRLEDGGDWPQGDVRDPSAAYLGGQDGWSYGVVAFEHHGAKGDEVWVLDYNQRDPYDVKIADGSEPAVSPDGTKVAYVGRNGQIQVAPAVGPKHTAKQVTFGAATPSHLVWTADGARIAYSTPQGVQSVAAIPVGSKSNPATSLTSKPASVSFLLGRANRVDSLTGDPVAAALKASQLRWPAQKTYSMTEANGPASAVVIASSAEPDVALAASQVARRAHGPLLLTTGQDLDPAVRDEVRRVLGKVEGRPGDTMVYLVGKLSASAESELRALGYSTEHFTGTPTAVSLAAAKALNPSPNYESVMVVEPSNTTAAALSIVDGGMATLLTDGDKLSSQAHAYVDVAAVHGKVYAIGDKARAAVRPTHISDLGVDSSSSVAYAQHFTAAPLSAVVVDSADPRMLAIAVSLALSANSPLLLAADAPMVYLDKTSGVTDRVYVVGSDTSGLTDEISEAIG